MLDLSQKGSNSARIMSEQSLCQIYARLGRDLDK